MRPNEYLKKCPYCEKEFKADHLSRSYCTERCKRRMYRSKKQEKRKVVKMDKDQYTKNSMIIAKLYRTNLKPYEEKDLIKAGYDSYYMKDRLEHEDKLLITYDNHYLEMDGDRKIIIHKK